MRPLLGALFVSLAITVLAWPAAAGTSAKDHDGARLAGRALPAQATLPPGTLSASAAVVPLPAAEPADTWTTLFADNFEGAFPGPWQIVDNGLFSGAGWGRWTCWSGATPTHSVGSAAGGSQAITCDGSYYNDMDAWMVYGPFSLAGGITAAELNLNFRLQSEAPGVEVWDYFSVLASTNGANFYGSRFAGTLPPQAFTLDLANVSGLGNLLGATQVWIALYFHSDSSVVMPNGAQVDDVVLRVATATANQTPVVTVTSPNGGESWPGGATRNITWTASDPDGGPNPLAVAIDWSSNGGGDWQSVVTGLTNTGSYAWTVPSAATTSARVRVRASDGSAAGEDASNANFTITVTSPGDNAVSVGNGEGMAGTSFALPVTLANDAAVKGLQLDVLYDANVFAFTGASATGRGAGMTVGANVVSAGRARVVMYHGNAATMAAGDGEVARLIFEAVGHAGQSSAVTPADIIVSDAEGLPLTATGAQGTATVAAATATPSLQISVLRNPGRPRTLQVLVNVARGSGNAPAVTVGGAPVTMSALGSTRYIGTYSVAAGIAEVQVVATDTNGHGQGTGQVTVTF